jgi:hypothetical protein
MSPLEILFEVRKEIEIAWRHVRAVGRMGENLKLQRLQSINRYASSVRSCIVRRLRWSGGQHAGTRVHGFKPGRSRWIFSVHEKILSMPSFRGEVKESVPCPNFAACKRT